MNIADDFAEIARHLREIKAEEAAAAGRRMPRIGFASASPVSPGTRTALAELRDAVERAFSGRRIMVFGTKLTCDRLAGGDFLAPVVLHAALQTVPDCLECDLSPHRGRNCMPVLGVGVVSLRVDAAALDRALASLDTQHGVVRGVGAGGSAQVDLTGACQRYGEFVRDAHTQGLAPYEALEAVLVYEFIVP